MNGIATWFLTGDYMKMIQNMKLLLLSLIFALLIGVSACNIAGNNQTNDSGQEVDIRYGGQYYPGEFLLKGYDFFDRYDLNVEHRLFSSGTENNEALISGNVDVNVGSDSKSAALFSAIGDEALIIGTVQRGNRYSTIVSQDSEYQEWEDLKGKTVGTRFGSGAEFVLRKYFDSREDLAWEDFSWVNIKTEDMISALDNGQIEAFTVWAPTGEIAEAIGVGRVLRNYGDVALTPVSIHTTRTFAQEHEDELVRFLAAQLDKQKMIEESPELAARYAVQTAKERGMDVPEEAFVAMFERINFQIDIDESIISELEQTAQFLVEQGKLENVPEFQIDTSYLEKAQELVEQ